jgi:hypothetical protein
VELLLLAHLTYKLLVVVAEVVLAELRVEVALVVI